MISEFRSASIRELIAYREKDKNESYQADVDHRDHGDHTVLHLQGFLCRTCPFPLQVFQSSSKGMESYGGFSSRN